MVKTSTGHKADATLVMRLLGSGYDSWNRRSVHSVVVKSLVAVKPDLVLDLCAGGGTLRLMSEAGLPVLTVDDGRDPRLAANGISKDRYRRAMEVKATELGQEAAWGRAEKHAHRADAAFFDFLGQWSKENRRTLEASRHMKAIAVTFMLDRMELGERGKLTDADWIAAYRGMVEDATWMRVRWWRIYRRNEYQQKAVVFFLRPATRSGSVGSCVKCGGMRPADRRLCPHCAPRTEQHRRAPLPFMASAEDHKKYHKRKYYEAHRDRYAELGAARYAARKGLTVEQVVARRAQRAERVEAIRTMLTGGARPSEVARALGVSSALVNYHRKQLAAVSGTAAEAISSEVAA